MFRDRYRAFTVDEYQDVNLLQQTLLELWLGDRDDLCVVGDDYQSIYGFTGATPRWLLGVAERFPHAHVVRLEENYRSSPEVLELANRLVPRLGGAEKVLRATREHGSEPIVRPFPGPDDEDEWIAGEVKRLAGAGVPLEEMAVLCPDERATGRLRRGIPRSRDPVPGLVAARARGRAQNVAAARARQLERRRRARPPARRGGRDALHAPRQARRA